MALIIVSLGGIIVLQMVLLKSAYDQKEEAFRQSVGTAMAGVSAGLEKGVILSRVFAAAATIPGQAGSHTLVSVQTEERNDTLSTRIAGGPRKDIRFFPMRVTGNNLWYTVETPQHVSIHVFDLMGREDTTIVDTFRNAGEYTVSLDPGRFRNGEYFYKYSADSNTFVVQSSSGVQGGVVTKRSGRGEEQMVSTTVDQLFAKRLPLEQRVKKELLDSLVQVNMKEAGIDMPCVYAVLSGKPDSVHMASQPGFNENLRTTEFRTRLFPGDFLAPRNDLVVYFPGRTSFLLRSMAPLAGATMAFMAGIIFAFIYSIRAIVAQRKLSHALIDFINNMTHEFKTPISTIALASEAIARPDVLPHEDKVTRYNGIIRDENFRMKQQVDKILQMAVLEKGDYELNIVPVDVHEVIRKAAENIMLQVDQKGGTITSRLEAESSIVLADPLHAANVIHNILDNASKYSVEAPCIETSTWNSDGRLWISIRDHGIGMKEDDARRAFEKYFRAATGNRHDVKGFGLGLAYVKLMVEAIGGHVRLTSSPGKGTTVEMVLPVAQGGRT